jgi:hypothetical protein
MEKSPDLDLENSQASDLFCGFRIFSNLEGKDMRFPKAPVFIVALTILFCSWSIWAQDSDREVEIHKNVKLMVTSTGTDIPADLVSQYKAFLPLFETVLKESIADQTEECAITFRLAPGVKEVGAAKTKRPTARVTAFRRNSKQEFLGVLILYSYATSGLVNKEETEQFLTKQILQPAECHKTE